MKRYILLLVTALVFAVSANAAGNVRPRHGEYFYHNHSLRFVRFAPRTCPECARIAHMHHVRHHAPVPPHHHAPVPPRHHAPAPAPRHHAPAPAPGHHKGMAHNNKHHARR
ncbi:MAG: hypothetical protein IKX36_09430 [Prevotella sp.]|nr:hypothetical protein [Prevotella sp.]